MEFLKRHYEKLSLAFTLVLFIGMLLYLVHVAQTIGAVPEVQIREAQVDFVEKAVDRKAPVFQVQYLFTHGVEWVPSSFRKPVDTHHFSDLVEMFPSARCPFCQKIIPRYYFHDREGTETVAASAAELAPRGECVLCHKALKSPPVKEVVKYNPYSDDGDGDGIPNLIEEEQGLDPRNPEDALWDKDNDGFSNLFEYLSKTLMDDPKSHPPMWYRLFIKEFRNIVLPVRLMAVNTNSSDDKNEWMVQISEFDLKSNSKGKDKGMFAIGQEVRGIDGRNYIIEDIDLRQQRKKIGETETVDDQSIVKLKQVNGDVVITMQVGKEVLSPTVKAIVVDSGNITANPTGREYVLDVGNVFAIGDRTNAGEVYQVREINEKAGDGGEVRLARRDGRTFVPLDEPLTRAGKIPPEQRVRPSRASQGQ